VTVRGCVVIGRELYLRRSRMLGNSSGRCSMRKPSRKIGGGSIRGRGRATQRPSGERSYLLSSRNHSYFRVTPILLFPRTRRSVVLAWQTVQSVPSSDPNILPFLISCPALWPTGKRENARGDTGNTMARLKTYICLRLSAEAPVKQP